MARRRPPAAPASPDRRGVPVLLAVIRDPSTTGRVLLDAVDDLQRADSMTYYRDVLDDVDVSRRYMATFIPQGMSTHDEGIS